MEDYTSSYKTKKTRKRKCLGPCGKEFDSTGPGNRICKQCANNKTVAYWRMVKSNSGRVVRGSIGGGS